MNAVYAYFIDEFRMKRQAVLLKRALYIFVLIKCIQWIRSYDLLFGANSIAIVKDFDYLLFYQNLAFILYKMKGLNAAYLFILPCFIISGLGFFKLRIPFLTDLLLWILVLNIHNRIYPTLSGGEILLNQLLFFSAFLSMKFDASKNTGPAFFKIIHNFANIGLILQICFVYFFSSLAKMQDEEWMNGTALGTTLQALHFSTNYWAWAAITFPAFFVFLNYTVMAYQFLFPVGIALKKIKRSFILIGVLMHLFIAFAMGLMSFGAIMIISYIYFWPFKEKTEN
jgi:hypothetical protein